MFRTNLSPDGCLSTDVTDKKGASVMEVLIEERIVKKVSIRVSADGEKHRDKMRSECRCLGCGEKFSAAELTEAGKVKRGLHNRCYEAFRRARDRGEVTEKEMVRNGKMLEPDPGRPLSNPLAKELAGK